MYDVKKQLGVLYVMKLLSFRVNEQVKFGPKVKKEEAVWDVVEIQKQLNVLPAFPETIIDGIALGYDFVEQVRKLIDAAQKDENGAQYKLAYSDIEWLSPIPRTPKNILCVGKNYNDHAL